MSANHYATLEIPTNASLEDIRKAHKKLAFKYHPDKNPNVPHTKIADINNAYDVLSDPIKKQTYDVKLKVAMRSEASSSNFASYHSSSRTKPSGFNRGYKSFFNSHFHPRPGKESFFRGTPKPARPGNPPPSLPTPTPPPPPPPPTKAERAKYDIKVNVQVTLEEVFSGAVVSVTYKERVLCEDCKGKSASYRFCSGPACRGRRLSVGFCSRCKSADTVKVANACKACKGHAVSTVERVMSVHLERGIPNGQEENEEKHEDEYEEEEDEEESDEEEEDDNEEDEYEEEEDEEDDEENEDEEEYHEANQEFEDEFEKESFADETDEEESEQDDADKTIEEYEEECVEEFVEEDEYLEDVSEEEMYNYPRNSKRKRDVLDDYDRPRKKKL